MVSRAENACSDEQIGSGFGLFGHWRSTCAYAEMCAKHYPTILSHSLWTSRRIVVPTTHAQDGVTMSEWMNGGGLGRYTWCVLAAVSCTSDIEEVQRKERQDLIDALDGNSKEE